MRRVPSIDALIFNVRLDDDLSCILVIIGATQDGKKELLAVHDGYRESKASRREPDMQDGIGLRAERPEKRDGPDFAKDKRDLASTHLKAC